MDAIELLTDDHNTVRDLFQRFNGGGGLAGAVRRAVGLVPAPERRTAVEQVCKELDLHTRLEEEVFYPAVRALDDDDLNKMVDEALEEHATVKQQLSRLRAVNGDEDDLDDRMGQLEQDVEHHASEEEAELFPRLQELMRESELTELGRRLAAMKNGASNGPGAAPPGRLRRGRKVAKSTTAPRASQGARAR